MSEDDHKITVETETVEAPVSGLLMSNAEANRPSSVKQNGGSGQSSGPPAAGTAAVAAVSADGDTVLQDDGGLAVAGGTLQGLQRSTSNSNNNNNNNNSSNVAELQPYVSNTKTVAAHEDPTSSGVVPGTNINLIDHNPLSPHVTQTSLRNKKSTLLIDSSLNGKGKKNKDSEEVPKHGVGGVKKDADSIRVSSLEKSMRNADHGQIHPHSISNQTSKNGSLVPTPLMLPVADLAGDPKPSKTAERASMPLLSTREHSLEDNKPSQNSAHNPNSNKSGALSSGNDSSNLRQHSSSSHHGGNDDPDHDVNASNKPTKADVFAARLASAVGENEISDSEETFIYESAANSTKNTVTPILIDSQLEQQQLQQANHGIVPKMSVPVLNNNAKLLSRLKDTRHTSMSALPMTAPKTVASPQFTTMPAAGAATGAATMNSMANTSANVAPTDDLKSMKSINRTNNNIKSMDMQSVKSLVSEPRSPDKRLSLLSLTKSNNNAGSSNGNRSGNLGNNNSGISNNNNNFSNTLNSASRNPSLSSSTLRHVSISQAAACRAKANSNDVYLNNLNTNAGKRNLRTTASKIFDANGAPLRRYSGVPDDVNLEDYIEQSNGHLMTTTSSSIKRDDRLKNYMENAHSNEFKRASYDLADMEHKSVIQEEADEQDNQEADEDDMRSMFYYNHRGDLEQRPQISDYDQDEDDEELDDDDHDHDDHDDHYYGYPYANEFVAGNNNANGNLSRQGRYFGSLPSILQPNAIVNHNGHVNTSPNANEFTPLQPKRQFLGDPLGYSPHNFYTRKSSWAKIKHFIYFTFVVISLLTVGFILGFLLATNKELQDLNIVFIDNILSSADELLFDITATAFNPGFFVLEIQDVNLDIFAKSAFREKTMKTPMVKDKEKPPLTETLKLGTVLKLETPMRFAGGFFKRNYDVSVSSIKLLNPGSKTDAPDDSNDSNDASGFLRQDEDNSKKWKSLIKYDYDLIIRGNMKYKIPFFRSEKSIAVQGSVLVHPDKDDEDDTMSGYNEQIVSHLL